MSIFDSKDEIVDKAIRVDRILTILNLSRINNITLWIVSYKDKIHENPLECVSGIIHDAWRSGGEPGKNNPKYKRNLGGSYLLDDNDIVHLPNNYKIENIITLNLVRPVDIKDFTVKGNEHLSVRLNINDEEYNIFLSKMLSYNDNTNQPKYNLDPEEVYQNIAKNIVSAALHYGQNIAAVNNNVSSNVGAEMLYMLLHLVDRKAYHLLDISVYGVQNPEIDKVFKEVSKIAITAYLNSVLAANTPKDIILDNTEKMTNTLHSRHAIYRECWALNKESLPSKGTMEFAFSFFIHRALGHTSINDVDDILIGEGDISDACLGEFPDPEDIIQAAVSIKSAVSTLRMHENLKHLEISI